MKKHIIGFAFVLITAALLINCKKQSDINACMSVDRTNLNVNQSVTVSNCGDELPSMVTITINWGDGSSETSGQTGTHIYTTAGTYTIKLMANGDPLSEKLGSTDNVEKTVTVN